MNRKKSIGYCLKCLRGNKPQQEIAKAIGVSKSAYSMYESDQRMPRDKIKIRIAEYYNSTVQEIFYE